eukprot:TRINITY_DN29119_c0_g1_i1.p4 TRINITY_DN29119_c0_g1~~TRINITY_DN29119_c0_g1_i1.p4  ORF type:complete len:122 (-),score=17.65 TRINITY_DN29119_c0_g1_i1:158-523(-)
MTITTLKMMSKVKAQLRLEVQQSQLSSRARQQDDNLRDDECEVQNIDEWVESNLDEKMDISLLEEEECEDPILFPNSIFDRLFDLSLFKSSNLSNMVQKQYCDNIIQCDDDQDWDIDEIFL